MSVVPVPSPDPGLGILRRAEEPALRLEDTALALHVVLPLPESDPAQPLGYPDCPDFRSMELDLLAYAFQTDPPFGSQCERHEPIPVVVRFPPTVQYHSEGRTMWLECAEPSRRASLRLSSTTFRDSRIQVWHFVFQPADGDRFTEFDLVKMIHLYDGRTEATALRDQVRFDLDLPKNREGKPTQDLTLSQLLALLAGSPAATAARAGTVQILAGGDLDSILGTVRKAREPDGAEEARRLKGWIRTRSREAAALQACCGIVTGIFDFDQLDDEEILDTLEPTFECSHLIRLHRCTLVSLSADDRAMTECRESIGISPYLLIPHAVLLNNEALVDRAEAAVASVLGTTRRRLPLGRLESARAVAEESLRRDMLPNVFNYVTERRLFAKGWESRGAEDRRHRAARRLDELRSVIESRWVRRRENGQTAVTALLALISVLQLQGIVEEGTPRGWPAAADWGILAILSAGILALVVAFHRLGLRE
jgi:hypothetical protein